MLLLCKLLEKRVGSFTHCERPKSSSNISAQEANMRTKNLASAIKLRSLANSAYRHRLGSTLHVPKSFGHICMACIHRTYSEASKATPSHWDQSMSGYAGARIPPPIPMISSASASAAARLIALRPTGWARHRVCPLRGSRCRVRTRD